MLPPEVEATLRRHEEAGTTDDPEYVEACHVFYERHVCRLDPWPPEVVEAFAWIERDPTVYHTMNGPSEFHVIGSIRDWQSKDRLGEIDVPTLLVSGRHDEATPALQQDAARRHRRLGVGLLRGLLAHAARRGARALHAGRRRLARAPRLSRRRIYPQSA